MRISFRGSIAVCLILIFTVLAVACGTEGKSRTEPAARVNDAVISQGQLDKYSTLYYYIEGYDPSEISEAEKQQCLDTMVDCEALRQYYEAQGRDIYNDEYDAGKNGFLSSTKETAADFLKENDITEEDLIYYYRNSYLQQLLYRDVQAEYSGGEAEAAARKKIRAIEEDMDIERMTREEIGE